MKIIFFLSSSVNSELLDVINSQSLYRCDIPLKLWVKKVSDAQISLVHILSRISKKKPLAILWFAFFCSTTFMSQKCGCVGALPPFAFLAKKIPLKNREPAKNNNIFSDPSFSIVWCWCKEWLTSWSPVRRDPNLGPDSANELPKMYLHRIELKQEKYYLNHKKSTGPPGPETSIWWPFWLALTSSFGPLALNSNTPDPRKGDHCHLLVHLLQWPFNPLAHKMGVYMY